MVEKHSELSPFAGQITCFGACSKARGQPRHLRSEPKKVSRFQRLYDLGPCLLTKETCKQVLLQFPHTTLQREGPITKGELAQDHGPWFQTWLWPPSPQTPEPASWTSGRSRGVPIPPSQPLSLSSPWDASSTSGLNRLKEFQRIKKF